MIVVQPIAGLANRMRVLDSAIALATETNQVLWVLWTSDRDLHCRFEELFVRPACIQRLYQVNTTRLAGKILYRIWRYVLSLLCDVQLTDTSLGSLARDGVDLASHVRGRRVAVFACKRFYDAVPRFSGLRPIPALRLAIDASSTHPDKTVGVHVRRGDSEWPIRYSPTKEFVRLMEAELRADAETVFLVASDSPDEENRLRRAFPERVHIRLKRSYDRDDPDGIQDGLVDLFALSNCRKLIGSFGSSFTEVAWQIRGIPRQHARVLPPLAVLFAGLTDVQALADEALCYDTVRRARWAQVVFCPECGGDEVVPLGPDEARPHLKTYWCLNCISPFDDLTGTELASLHGAIRPWLLCLLYANQRLSNVAIARQLDIPVSRVAEMRAALHVGAPAPP